MKKIVAFIIIILLSTQLPAQAIDQRRIEESVIGWKKVYSFKARNTSSPDGKFNAVNVYISNIKITKD